MGKVCSKCKVEKDLTEFGKNKRLSDGHHYYCKECKNTADKKFNESERGRIRRKKYRRTDKGKNNRSEYVREDRKNNPKKHLWRQLLKHACERMDTTKSASTIEMLKYSADELFEHLYSLGYKENDHIDHKIPLSWFHADTPQHIVNHLSNLQPMDPQTNISKGNSYADRVDEEYYRMARPYLL
mgnify:CR=1 FL=1